MSAFGGKADIAQCPPAASHRPGQSRSNQPAMVVRDRDSQALAYVYFEEEPGRRAAAALRRSDVLRERLEARFSGLCLPISKSVS